MNSSVLAYLENSAEYFPEKCAVTDEKVSYSYSELVKLSSSVGTALSELIASGDAVGIYMEKCADAVAAFFATVYAGGFYSVLNTELPQNRLQTTVFVLNPKVIVTSESLLETAKEYFSERKIVTFENLAKSEPDYAKLGEIRSHKIDTDPLYINFTSGSTGTPKGIVVCHRSVIDFIDHFTEIFGIDNNDVIANQAPFDFDVSVKDIYSAVKTGATLVVVPRRMFSAPAELIDFICDRRITVMIWAVSALCLISTFHALDYRTPETVNKILFSGEVMPLKALKNFRSHLPNAKYVNLYGPTEITCNCTYHILDNDCDYADGIPIGKPFPNEDVILLDENNNRISEVGKVGEICVRGTALALGYYSNPEQNAKAFVQNPLNPYYPELIYRTGDLARYNENGELVFSGRKDFQIKYMGHRIELEEIEREMSAVDGVEQCCCIFDEKKSRLKGFFVGSIEKDELIGGFAQLLNEMTSKPKITLELGRSIAAICGKYYTHIVDKKCNKGENYLLVDGGMNHIVYYGQHMAMKQPYLSVCGKETEPCTESWNICGSLCSMNDIIAKQISLPDIEIGDIICFENTGAYCMTEGISLFLSRDIPSVYIKKEDGTYLCVRDSFETFNLNKPNYRKETN